MQQEVAIVRHTMKRKRVRLQNEFDAVSEKEKRIWLTKKWQDSFRFVEEWDEDADESDKDEQILNFARYFKSSRCRRRRSWPKDWHSDVQDSKKKKINLSRVNRVDDLKKFRAHRQWSMDGRDLVRDNQRYMRTREVQKRSIVPRQQERNEKKWHEEIPKESVVEESCIVM